MVVSNNHYNTIMVQFMEIIQIMVISCYIIIISMIPPRHVLGSFDRHKKIRPPPVARLASWAAWRASSDALALR